MLLQNPEDYVFESLERPSVSVDMIGQGRRLEQRL